MVSLPHWKRCAWFALLPLYACAPLEPTPQQQSSQQQPSQQQVCAHQAGMQGQDHCYAVARPHSANDYPISYRAQMLQGHSTTIDRHALEAYSSVQRVRDSIIN